MRKIRLPHLTFTNVAAIFFRRIRKFFTPVTFALSITTVLLFAVVSGIAQPAIDIQPLNFPTTCQPNSNTAFTITRAFEVSKGTCGNSGNFTFVWQYYNGVSWLPVSNNTPIGFINYTTNVSNTGSGSNVKGASSLTITLGSAASTGTFQYRCVSTYDKCSGSPVTSNIITFTVNPKPAPTFIAQPGASICANAAVTYTTQSSQSGYTWGIPGTAGTDYTITGGSTSSGTVTLRWLTAGSKTVTINYTNSSGCTAATATSSTATTVVAQPVPSFTAQPSGTVCSSTDVTYTTQAGQSNYLWSYSGTLNTDYTISAGGTSTDNSVTVKWLSSGNKAVSISYTSSGCTAAVPVASNSVNITVRPVPTFTSVPGATACSGTDVTYTTQPGESAYLWTVPGSLGTDYSITSGGIGTASHTVTLKWLTAGSKTVSVNYSSGSCSGLTAATATTTVNTSPVASFITAPAAITCPGTDVTYTTEAGKSGYIWTVEGTEGSDYMIISGGTGTGSNSVTIQWLTTGSNRTVTVNYTDASLCTSLLAASSTTFIDAKPVPSFITGPDLTTCVNTAVTYSTQPGNSNYIWSVPGTDGIDYTITGGGVDTINNTVTLQWHTSGIKTVTVSYSNSNGCTAVTPASSVTTVDIPATPSITAGSSTTFCVGAAVTLTASSAASYQWYIDGIILPGAIVDTYAASTGGSYTVKVFDAAGCDATSTGTAVTVNPLPGITMSTQAGSLCFSSSAQTSTLTYSDISNAPDAYSIVWDAAAITAGFVSVTNEALTASPIDITVPANASANTYNGSIVVRNSNGCESAPNNFSVTVTSSPDISDLTISAADGCVGTGAEITVNSTTLANGNYTVTYDLDGANTATDNVAVMIFNGGSGSFTALALSAGSTNIVITDVALVGCNSAPSLGNAATFNINSLPAVDATTGPDSVCTGNSITLSNTTSSGSWSTADPNVATVNSAGVVTGVNEGVVNIIYTTAPNGNNCTNTSIKIIAVNSLPVVTAITGTTSLCTGTTTTLDNATTGGSWKSSDTSVATINASGVVTGLAAGTSVITYIFPANTSGCTDSTFTTITVDPAATADAGNEVPVCQSSSPTAISLNDAVIGGAATTGAWSILSGGGTLSSLLQTASPGTVTYTPDANYSGTVNLLLTTNAPGSCAAVTSSKTITVSQAPTAGAGITSPVCQSAVPSAIILSGATLGGGATTGAWSITSGSGVLGSIVQTTTPDTVTFTPAANYSGTVTLTLLTNVSGACAAVSSDRIITVSAAPTVIPGGPDTVCQGSPAITLTGAGFGGGAASAAWAITSPGGGTLSSTLQTISPAAVTYTPAVGFSGSVILTLTSDLPAGCSSGSATRTIKISAPPTVTPGGPDGRCQSGSPSALTLAGAGIGGGATTGAWSVFSGGGTLSSTLQTATPATVTYTPAVNFSGTVTLRLTTDVPRGCTSIFATRTINISTAPAANAGTTIVTCSDPAQTASGLAAVNITAGASAANNTGVLWSTSGTGTFTFPTSLTLATYTPSVADKLAGSVTLTLTAFGNASCGNATSTKTFTITPAIDANTSNNWTQVPNCNGLGVQFILPAAPGGGNGTFSYQWMQKNNCGTSGVSTPVPGANGPNFIPPADNCYWLFISSGGCSVPQNLVSGTNRQRPSTDTAFLSNINFGIGGTNPSICIGGSTTLTAQSSVSYTYVWTPSTGLSSTTGATVTANPSSTTIYKVVATATDGTGCTREAFDTVTVSPLTVAGTLPASVSSCGGTSTLTLSGNVGRVNRWESSTDGGANWALIADTTTILSYSATAQTTLYRALVQSGACSSAYSSVTRAVLRNVWTGKVSTDWYTAANWSDSSLPTLSCPNVTILGSTAFPAIVASGTATINNLIIDPLGSLTVAGATMQIAGSISNSGNFDVSNGGLELNGTLTQNIAGNMFATSTINSLTVSNPNGVVVANSPGNLLNIKDVLSFGNVNGATIQTGDNVVLLSRATGTARLADITNNGANAGNTVVGKFIVERYIPGRRAWRLLTAPVTPGSQVKISDSWQEGATPITNPAIITPASDPNPGYGTHITFGYPATNGFDQGVNGNTSIRYLNSTGWNGVPTATNDGASLNSGYVTDQPGYFVFVRGDRATQLSLATSAATSPTVLRMKGNINTGMLDIPLNTSFISGGANFRAVGNPYPSAINFHKVVQNGANVSGGFADAFYFWDPNVTGSNGVGGWVAMNYNSGTGLYDRNVLTGGSSSIDNTGDIQSGAAFMINYNGAAANLQVQEPNKATASNLTQFRPVNQVRASLLAKNADNSISVNDGALVTFDAAYNNSVDAMDMAKLSNFAENLGILSNNKTLAIERRMPVNAVDTIFFKMTQMKQKNYQLELVMNEMNVPAGTAVFLEDVFVNTRIPLRLKDTGRYNFSIVTANSASVNPQRLRLLFKPSVLYLYVSGYVSNHDIVIDWKIEDEIDIKRFEIERSVDGISFSQVGIISTKGESTAAVKYKWTDLNPAPGNYYYRIKSISNHDVTAYSNPVNVKKVNSRTGMYAFPNPVTSNTINLQFNFIDKGRYNVQLMRISGELILAENINHPGGAISQPIHSAQNLVSGTYQLKITGPDKKVHVLEVMVQK